MGYGGACFTDRGEHTRYTRNRFTETPDIDTGHTTSEAIIDRFLEHGGYRITPSADTPDGAPSPDSAEEEHDLDPDLVTEELAEIYLAQGHIDRANEIYRRLSLRNP